jgi:gliding motility-associated-like protein
MLSKTAFSYRFLIPAIAGFLCLFCQAVVGQNCTALGQNPETAFPVCGTASFTQSSVNICGDRAIPSRCTGNVFTDKNPYWYKFTCFTSGTLGFAITPNNIGDDYDWQLFDVTNRNPRDVYNDVSLFVACNWSGESGVTGASAAGNSLIRCEGPGVPLFSSMPFITQGRQYLLLVSHFTNTQSGYSLSFGGGTGSITDPTEPHLLDAEASCDATTIRVRLNKKMKCNSLTPNGSEFKITPPLANVTGAIGVGCTTGFDSDSLELRLNNPLPPGNYTLTINNGTDGNTLLDNCDRLIPNGEQIPLRINPIAPTPMDSLIQPGCAPSSITLVFKKGMKCSSIAPNGSDFRFFGSYPASIVSATGNCDINGNAKKITLNFNAPLYRAGTFRITLMQGSDGNTLIDECGQESPADQVLDFTVKDTVNADFRFTINFGCEEDIVQYQHNGANDVNSWNWTFQGLSNSIIQNPSVSYTNFTPQQTQLIVSNGVCSDTSTATIPLNNFLKAGFVAPQFICPNELAVFQDTSIGNIQQWKWDFGNGNTSSLQQPPNQPYLPGAANYSVLIELIVTNNLGCSDTAYYTSTVVWNCYIAVPSAFTPNNDGLNDYLYPVNAYKAKNLRFTVYNRFGQRLFYSENRFGKWDGKYRGKLSDFGTYVWTLEYTESDTGKKVFQKGTSILIK